MSDEPKRQSIWKKPLRGPIAWFVGWLALMVATAAIVCLFMPVLATSRGYQSEEMRVLVVFEAGATIFALSIALIWWLRRWRNLKRVLFGVACVATLIGLFYAEEDWRGRHAWRSYEQEMVARGEPVAVKDIVPPPVPDDKNFAMAPIIQRFYNFVLTTDGKHIPWEEQQKHPVEQLDFDLGDASWNTNAIGSWGMRTFSRLDLWQQHYRELAATTNQFAVPPQPQLPAADVLLALSKYDGMVEDIRKAAQLPECRFPLNYDDEDPAAILLPHLASLKRTSLLLRLRALAELENGQSDKAAADVLLTLRLTDYIRDEPTYISVLVRMAMVEVALQPIYEGLARHQWTDSQLTAIEDELNRLDYLEDFNHVLRWEQAFSNGVLDYVGKRDTHRRYVELFGEIYGDEFTVQSQDELADYKGYEVALMPAGWLDLNRLAIAQFHERWFPPITDAGKHQINTAAADDMQAALRGWHGNARNFMLKPFLVSFERAPHKIARQQATVDLTRTAVALERYRLAQGAYPETLDALAPKFIDKVPTDVIGGQPLKYRREADGQFTLYSVGWNGQDDGGVMGHFENSEGHSEISERPDFDHGDWVWRYPKL